MKYRLLKNVTSIMGFSIPIISELCIFIDWAIYAAIYYQEMMQYIRRLGRFCVGIVRMGRFACVIRVPTRVAQPALFVWSVIAAVKKCRI